MINITRWLINIEACDCNCGTDTRWKQGYGTSVMLSEKCTFKIPILLNIMFFFKNKGYQWIVPPQESCQKSSYKTWRTNISTTSQENIKYDY